MAINENDSRVKRTKKLIRKGITELAKEKSINKITVKELTDLIEINRGTFYLHYKDIYDLVESIENNIYDDFNTIISSVNSQSLIESPIDILESFCVFVNDNADVFAMLIGEHGDAEFVYKIGTTMNQKCKEIFRNIYPNMNDDIYQITYDYCKAGSIGLLRCWLLNNREWTPRYVAEIWLMVISRGVWGITNRD